MSDEVDEFFSERTDGIAEICRAARGLVLDVLPDARETVDRPDELVAYAIGPRAMKDLWVAIAPHTAHVNLQLANGALLDDPEDLVEGTGKRIRHIKLRSVADVARPQVRVLLEQSLELLRSEQGG